MFLLSRKLEYYIRKIYSLPASVTLVIGDWKTGKTDFALWLYQILLQLGLVSRGASNIKTEGSNLEYIDSLLVLKQWLFLNPFRKTFLYDEMQESTVNRRAMSNLNVEWLKTIPQLSKGRCHLIAITQTEDYTDSVFLNNHFWRGTWKKVSLSDKSMVVLEAPRKICPEIQYISRGIPRTTIKFDPYLEASFNLNSPNISLQNTPIEIQIMKLYGEGKNYQQIAIELKLSQRNYAMRSIQKICRNMVTMLQNKTLGLDNLTNVTKEQKETFI
jgi:hypothetical protein